MKDKKDKTKQNLILIIILLCAIGMMINWMYLDISSSFMFAFFLMLYSAIYGALLTKLK